MTVFVVIESFLVALQSMLAIRKTRLRVDKSGSRVIL